MGHRKGDPRPDEQVQTEPGDNARRVRIMRELMSQAPCNLTDNNAVVERYIWYLNVCEMHDDRPTVAGFALAMGYTREHIRHVKDGVVKSVPQDVVLTLKRVWDGLNQLMEQFMMDGKLNPATAIFLLKNNFGYKDVVETVVAKKDPYENGNPEEIARKYLSGMAPAIEAPTEIARENAPIVETMVIDQTGTVE